MLLTLFLACSNTQKQAPSVSHGLFAAYSAEFSNNSQDYLEQILFKLWSSIPNPSTNRYHVLVLESSDPLALSLGSGYVVLSKGLILNLSHEGELYFVLAHEIAHHELGHIDQASHSTPELEIEADSFAMTSLMNAGYDPADGFSAVVNLMKYAAPKRAADYPSLENRIQALRNTTLSQQVLKPTNLRSNREFTAFKRDLN
ncbi:MAG: M48 family metallopeptidase [Bdellovibrionota bacterium]